MPKMPSLGLLLEQPIFDSYNKKVSSINEKLDITDPEYRPPIDFENFQDSINKFKQNHIYDNMRSIEDRDGVYVQPFVNADSEFSISPVGLTRGSDLLTPMAGMICCISTQRELSLPQLL